MTLTELRYVLAVAREGHFGRAADSCFVTQPTLSIGIKKLEEDLGVVIFERNHKEIIITPFGKKIIEQMEKALKEIKRVKELANTLKDPLLTPLRIGAIYTVGPYLFPEFIRVIRRDLPTLRLLVEENYTSVLAQRLLDGDIDVAIVATPFDEPEIETLAVYEEPFVALLSSSHYLAQKQSVSIADLSKETILLLGPSHCLREQIISICPAFVHTLEDKTEVQDALAGSSIETIRYMVASGVGVTIFPASAACVDRYKNDLLVSKPIENVHIGRKIMLAWRKHFPHKGIVDVIANSIHLCRLPGVKILQPNIDEISSTPLMARLLEA